MATLPTACPLDCPDICSLEVEVADGRVCRIDGTRINSYTDGFICGKVRKFADHVYGEHRLATPLLRTGDKGIAAFRRCSWDEALQRVATELARARDRHGGESILGYAYGGSNGWLTDGSADERLWRRLGASQLQRTFCAAPSGYAERGLYGRMRGVALEDYDQAQMITVWGTNPSATGIHFVPVAKRALERGATLVVVDPREIPLAKQAQLHIAPRPGTDLPLALGFINALFERGAADETFLAEHATGADQLREAAAAWPLARAARVADVPLVHLEQWIETYIAASPAVIRCGWGPERNRNGGSAVAAILALPAVAGKFGMRAGGYTMSNGGAWDTVNKDAAANAPEPDTRTINMTQLGRALCELNDPPIAALFVYNCNPLSTAPEQNRVREGLLRDDLFTVVFDQVMTDTARYADVVLPATTFLEHRDLRGGYGVSCMFDGKPVISPVGEARPNYEVFAELCDRLDLSRDDDPRTPDELVASILHDGSWRAQLERDGVARPEHPNPIQFVDVFPNTPDRKVHLFPESLDRGAPDGLYQFQDDPATADYPLALISPAPGKTISSTMAQLIDGIVPVTLAPDDAAPRRINPGDKVRVFNARGEVITDAAIDPGVRQGTAVLPKGLWSKHSYNGNTGNALCPDTEADLGRGACYNDARVQIERVDT